MAAFTGFLILATAGIELALAEYYKPKLADAYDGRWKECKSAGELRQPI
jgi:hypothetical protein